jgi:ubiquinone/menaquinone biosynthesis C-methylase UbiE
VNPDHLKIRSSEYWYESLRDNIMPWVIGGVDLGDDVLEVGPGPGLTTDLLLHRIKVLTTVELDDKMAADLSSRLAGTNVKVVHGDATAMPVEARRFTGATSFAMLHHVPTTELQDQLFTEVARVLQPGGAFAAFDGITNEGIAAFHEKGIYNPIDPSTLESRLLGAGFTSIEVQTNELGWAAKARIST